MVPGGISSTKVNWPLSDLKGLTVVKFAFEISATWETERCCSFFSKETASHKTNNPYWFWRNLSQSSFASDRLKKIVIFDDPYKMSSGKHEDDLGNEFGMTVTVKKNLFSNRCFPLVLQKKFLPGNKMSLLSRWIFIYFRISIFSKWLNIYKSFCSSSNIFTGILFLR